MTQAADAESCEGVLSDDGSLADVAENEPWCGRLAHLVGPVQDFVQDDVPGTLDVGLLKLRIGE